MALGVQFNKQISDLASDRFGSAGLKTFCVDTNLSLEGSVYYRIVAPKSESKTFDITFITFYAPSMFEMIPCL